MSAETQTKIALASADSKAKAAGAAAAEAEVQAEQAQAEEAAAEAEPETREQRAVAVVKKYMYGNAVASLLPVPILDLVAISSIQFAMVRAVAQVYEVPFRQEAVREVVTTLLSGVGSGYIGNAVAFSFAKMLPGVGTALGVVSLPILAGAFTYAVGRVYIMHFEAGGNIINLDPKKMRAYFEQQFKEGLEKAKVAAKEQVSAAK